MATIRRHQAYTETFEHKDYCWVIKIPNCLRPLSFSGLGGYGLETWYLHDPTANDMELVLVPDNIETSANINYFGRTNVLGIVYHITARQL